MKNLIHYFPYIIIYLKKSKHIRKVIASPVIKFDLRQVLVGKEKAKQDVVDYHILSNTRSPLNTHPLSG